MDPITIPDDLAAALTRAGGPVSLQSASGDFLGRFLPESPVPWDPKITRAELDRIANEQDGPPLAEFWQRVQQK